LKDYYPREFLGSAFYVVVDEIPLPPDLPSEMNSFKQMKLEGITYDNTYFLKAGYEKSLELHVHELVHVAQWQYLGINAFIERYFREFATYGYQEMPLEKMAYHVQDLFSRKAGSIEIPKWVRGAL